MKPEHVKDIHDNLDPLMEKIGKALKESNLGHLKVKSLELTPDPGFIRPHTCHVDPQTGVVFCD